MEFNEFTGNIALREKLKTDIVSGTLPHAIIIEGVRGSGKSTVARHIALLLNCKHSPDVCYLCDSCKKILGKNHTDVVYISVPEGKTQLGIESVRFMKSDVYIKPNESDYKVYIIQNAERMTPEAQNALLKVLEEPPARVVIMLLGSKRLWFLIQLRRFATE